MAVTEVLRERTAIGRTRLSRPVRLTLELGLLKDGDRVFDYGCGLGDDVRRLADAGIDAFGWDPAHLPHGRRQCADIVNLGYVLNVIEEPGERAATLRHAWSFANRLLVVTARTSSETRLGHTARFGDGYRTSRKTFQKVYSQTELGAYIEGVLATPVVSAAPGVFFVFRDDRLRQQYIASRYRRAARKPRRRVSDTLYEKHRDLLGNLERFVLLRGRLPSPDELAQTEQMASVFGSVPKAFLVLRRVTGPGPWEQAHKERKQDLCVYLALQRFYGRPRWSELPSDQQNDVKAFFGSYAKARRRADALLFSVGRPQTLSLIAEDQAVGKVTREALYVHVSAMQHLAPEFRVYEGCVRASFGDVEWANVVKLSLRESRISYLAYPEFDRTPHPSLREALSVTLPALGARYRDYSTSDNPPVLHRKELLVGQDYPHHGKFSRLTAQEERWGLLDSSREIGHLSGWQRRLNIKGARIKGHRVVRAPK